MRGAHPIAAIAAAALLAALPAAARAEDDPDAGAEGDGGAEEPELDEPFVPGAEPAAAPGPAYDDAAPGEATPEEPPDGRPFAQGDMEPGAGFGFAGYGSLYYMMIGASFAYYVVNGFAPGLGIQYGTDFGSADVPDDVTILPFAKFVMYRSPKFAPYVIALGGREFEFAGESPVHSWIVGGGLGAHIGFGRHFSLRIEVTFQHHWYDDPRIRGYDDGRLYKDADGNEYPCPSGVACGDLGGWVPAEAEGGEACLCSDDTCAVYVCETEDKSDLTHEWIFPIVTIGAAFVF